MGKSRCGSRKSTSQRRARTAHKKVTKKPSRARSCCVTKKPKPRVRQCSTPPKRKPSCNTAKKPARRRKASSPRPSRCATKQKRHRSRSVSTSRSCRPPSARKPRARSLSEKCNKKPKKSPSCAPKQKKKRSCSRSTSRVSKKSSSKPVVAKKSSCKPLAPKKPHRCAKPKPKKYVVKKKAPSCCSSKPPAATPSSDEPEAESEPLLASCATGLALGGHQCGERKQPSVCDQPQAEVAPKKLKRPASDSCGKPKSPAKKKCKRPNSTGSRTKSSSSCKPCKVKRVGPPTKPPGPYMIFFKEYVAEKRKKIPCLRSKEVTKEAAAVWNRMSPKRKMEYRAKYCALKKAGAFAKKD